MTEKERDSIIALAEILQVEINRMCVTKDLSEFHDMCVYAKKNLEKLTEKIYFYKFKPESEEE